jgi:hypothetical protein
MRRFGLPLLALLLLCPLSLEHFGANEAQAGSRRAGMNKARGASKARPKTKPAPVSKKKADPSKDATDPVDGEDSATASAAPVPTRGPTRIDFDDRLIQGQTNKSGAVYLYDRKELKTRSMVKKRESFREEIVASVYEQ